MIKRLYIFWQFCRPHTIIGSLVSVTTLYILVAGNAVTSSLYGSSLFSTLVASLACNIFIVGLNQYIDVGVDKINKPHLPLASGAMRPTTAIIILGTCLLISIAAAFYSSLILGLLICIILVIGVAYSVPPIQLKKHHIPAAIAIALVRGILVNVGMFLHFRWVMYNTPITTTLPYYLITLTTFVVAFSIAIAWFKDLPDTEGDAQFHFKTLSVLYNRKIALQAGCILVSVAYIFCIINSYANAQPLLYIAHLVLLVLFLANCFTIKIKQVNTFKAFYMRFWVLFFLEYIVYAFWILYQ